MRIRGLFLGCIAALLCAVAAGEPTLVLSSAQEQPRINLAQHLRTMRLPAQAQVDPEVLWERATQGSAPAGSRWAIGAGERWVGALTLVGGREREVVIVEIPVPSIDDVRVWHRTAGGPWQGGTAGDRVPLSRWPFANQFLAFPVSIGQEPTQLLVEVANAALLRVEVALQPDAAFRESSVRRASLSGVVMGLGGMFAIVCAAGAIAARRRPQVLSTVAAAWTLLAVICNNGYMAVWFTPEATVFNDISKHFSAMVLFGLLVLLVAEVLDRERFTRTDRTIAWLLPALAVAYAVAQQVVLPQSWRIVGAAIVALSSVLVCAWLCVASRLRGGRYTSWAAGAVAFLALAGTLPFMPTDHVAGLDLRAVVVAASLYAAQLLLRQALVLRERYGRDVLSRAAISANRDLLTALWSYEGFRQRYAEAGLRAGAGQGAASMMVFMLPGLERSGAEHGVVLTERTLVRFAATLQRLLGQRWAIGRLSKTRFAAISLRPLIASELVHTATQALSQAARIEQPLSLVNAFDLRIACRHTGVGALPLVDMLRTLEEAGRALDNGKRITLL